LEPMTWAQPRLNQDFKARSSAALAGSVTQIVAGGGDCVLTVNANQGRLLEDIQATVERALDGQLPAAQVDQ
jgi:hypothetical protein